MYLLVNSITVYSVVLCALLVWKDRKTIRGAHHIMFFFFCLFGYLTIEHVDHFLWKHLLLVGPLMLPFAFWMFSRSLFSDDEWPQKKLMTYLLLTLATYYGLYVLAVMGFAKTNLMLSHILSLFFVLLALKEALVGRQADLDENRIRIRSYFVYGIGVIVIVTLLVEVGLSMADQMKLRVLQRSIILAINSVFIVFNFSIKSKLLSKRKKNGAIQYPQLIEKIQSVMSDQQHYRQEKLTIGQLAELVNEQEYKVRRAINQDLGYRNFIDFVNSYRIGEAMDLLKNPEKSELTILEIAYQTGFNSIGPFNRAFKMTTGYTPTDYRKRNR